MIEKRHPPQCLIRNSRSVAVPLTPKLTMRDFPPAILSNIITGDKPNPHARIISTVSPNSDKKSKLNNNFLPHKLLLWQVFLCHMFLYTLILGVAVCDRLRKLYSALTSRARAGRYIPKNITIYPKPGDILAQRNG